MTRQAVGPALSLFAMLVAWMWSASAFADGKDRCKHVVAQGDTLSGIAVRHGVSERELVQANPALQKNRDLLRIGQTLDVCPSEPEPEPARDSKSAPDSKSKSSRGRSCGKGGHVVEHEVRSGDTLGEIASEYGVGQRDIIERNDALAKGSDTLRVGQVLELCVDERRPTAKSKLCDNKTPLFVHEVVPGEHVGQIAGRYGIRRGDLIRWNASLRENPDRLRVGQKLRVCPEIPPRERSQITYTVQDGDTLGGIALEYGLTPRELERYQQGKLSNPNALRSGQRLVVWVDGGEVPGFGGIDDDTGVLKGGLQLPPGRHYHVKWAAAAWGTSRTVRAIQSAVAAYKARMPGGPKVHVGDISKRSGGKFPPHMSHQHGRDVDVGYVLKGSLANETKFRTATASNLDVPRTWALVKAFIDTDDVQYIFMDYRIQKMLYEYALERGVDEDTLDELFQYPRGRGRTHGIVRHWRGHANHFHVRFRR